MANVCDRLNTRNRMAQYAARASTELQCCVYFKVQRPYLQDSKIYLRWFHRFHSFYFFYSQLTAHIYFLVIDE